MTMRVMVEDAGDEEERGLQSGSTSRNVVTARYRDVDVADALSFHADYQGREE
ncbi:hypothetical protein [Neoroseomonas rubea]|uniref:hypothetical protein n=1 Tax=Neoroseomonas rubea TaxID=2748666 RepID=UPI0018DF9BD4|nr:hypothetical protein [Roseomonas rubea]